MNCKLPIQTTDTRENSLNMHHRRLHAQLRTFAFSLVLALFSIVASADQRDNELENIPEPPPMPAESDEFIPSTDGSGEIKADVTIIRKKDRTIEEYRVNGQLRMVRITPTKGKPYYLLYPKNGGSPVRKDLDDIQTPYWKLFEW